MKPEVLLVITLESEIMEKYKENFDDDVRMMEKYGGIDPQNGDYLPFFVEDVMVHCLDTLQKNGTVKGQKLAMMRGRFLIIGSETTNILMCS